MDVRVRSLAAVILAAALVIFGFFASPSALAHDQLVSSNPSDGAKLDKQPEWLELEFSGDVQKIGTEIVVDHNGKDVSAGEISVDGTSVKSALPDDLGAGDYTVKWRVVSQDGHPISGDFTFSIADQGGAGGSASADSEGGAGLGAGAVDDPQNAPADDKGDLAVDQSSNGLSAPMIILLVIGGLAVIAAVIVLLLRKSRSMESPGSTISPAASSNATQASTDSPDAQADSPKDHDKDS